MGVLLLGVTLFGSDGPAGGWEITTESERSLDRGLEWLAANQGPAGNWDSNDLGLVGLGALAFVAAGHAPGEDVLVMKSSERSNSYWRTLSLLVC